MKLFLEKEFLEQFFIEFDENNAIISDFLRFLKELKNFQLIVNTSDITEFEQEVHNNPFLELMINESVPKLSFNAHLRKDVLSEDFYKDDTYPFKLFLLDSENEECMKLSKDYGYEYLCISNLSDRWNCYFSGREDTKMKVTKNKRFPDKLRFDSYEKMKCFTHPLNSILIIDKYILVNNKGSQEITENFIPLLKVLLNKMSDKIEIDILILTRKMFSDVRTTWEFLMNEVKSALPNKKINLNLVRDEKHLYPAGHHGIKGRRIITNYFTISSEDSFTFFNSNGSTKGISDIRFDFNFEKNNWLNLQFELNEIKEYVDHIVLNDDNDITYFKSKRNRMLK